MSFLPTNYKVPKAPSRYLKFEDGQNKFRIISDVTMGYEYWNADNKPVRMKEYPEQMPVDIRDDSKIKHFWAFIVIDRKDNMIKICEITQATIMRNIQDLVVNPDWSDPKEYDITISKTGESLETKYTVQPSPHKEITGTEMELINKTPVNLEALFEGTDPFAEQTKIAAVE